MPASGLEIRPRRITNDGVVRMYHVTDAPTEDDLVAYIATLPGTVGGWPFSGYEAEEIEDCEGADEYFATVNWGNTSPPEQPTAGTSSYKFSYQAPSGHIKRSLFTISDTPDEDIFPFSLPLNGALHVVDYGTADMRVEGLDLQPPAEVFSIPYTDVDAVINGTYQALVRSLCGKVNNSTFLGMAAGECMLVRVDGQRTNRLWNLDFGFAYIANSTNIPVGDVIVVPAKDGMDYLWALDVTTTDGTAKSLITKPGCAYVERVWERADLNALNLP